MASNPKIPQQMSDEDAMKAVYPDAYAGEFEDSDWDIWQHPTNPDTYGNSLGTGTSEIAAWADARSRLPSQGEGDGPLCQRCEFEADGRYPFGSEFIVHTCKTSCSSCGGRGTEADYVGLEMRCVEVECSACNGTGKAPTPSHPQPEVRHESSSYTAGRIHELEAEVARLRQQCLRESLQISDLREERDESSMVAEEIKEHAKELLNQWLKRDVALISAQPQQGEPDNEDCDHTVPCDFLHYRSMNEIQKLVTKPTSDGMEKNTHCALCHKPMMPSKSWAHVNFRDDITCANRSKPTPDGLVMSEREELPSLDSIAIRLMALRNKDDLSKLAHLTEVQIKLDCRERQLLASQSKLAQALAEIERLKEGK